MYWPFEWEGSRSFSIPFYERDAGKLDTISLSVKRRCSELLNKFFTSHYMVPSFIKFLSSGVLCFFYSYQTRVLMLGVYEDGHASLIVTEGEEKEIIYKETVVGEELERAVTILTNGEA